MTDVPANMAPVKDDAIEHLYGRKGATTGDGFVRYAENQFAHAVGLTASDKGTTPYVDANGDMARLAIGSATAVKYVNASGLPVWGAGGGADGQSLVLNAGVPTWTTAPIVFKLISTQTVSSPVAAVTFTSIPAGYSKFILVGSKVQTTYSGGLSDTVQVQVSTDNGSTFKTSSTDYYNATTGQAFIASAAAASSSGSVTFPQAIFNIELLGLGVSDRATHGVCVSSYRASTTSNIPQSNFTTNGATRAAAEADNAFRLISSNSANFVSGCVFSLFALSES